MRPSRAADLSMAGILVVLAGVILWEQRRWPPATGFAGDPLILPRALAMLMLLAALALAWLAWRAAASGGSDADTDRVGTRRALLGVATAVAFATALQRLGLIVAAAPFLVALQMLAGATWRQALPAAIAAPLLIWLIFAVGLHVPLPAGILAR